MSDDMTLDDYRFAAAKALAGRLKLRSAAIRNLRWDDVTPTADGVLIRIVWSKTDEGSGPVLVNAGHEVADALLAYRRALSDASVDVAPGTPLFPGMAHSLRGEFVFSEARRGPSVSQLRSLHQWRRTVPAKEYGDDDEKVPGQE